ncbi:hypothetical protein ACJIZ3_005959 [Penstemon smallii]|uniref:Leucine-rich repeat-containing N-terminal plant-type domain-containing protein n=1 Tax=Penstemon smallii TaxID=265156 RepID=A0ABD3S6B9_9LAMI
MKVLCLAASPINSSTDEHSLLAIKSHIFTSDPNYPLASNWSVGTDFCTSIGITCSRRHPRATKLSLPYSGLQGTIAKEIGNLSFLTILDLTMNNLSGQLSNLETLDVLYNPLVGTVSEDHFAKLSKLLELSISSLKFKVKSDWVPPFRLQVLALESCNIGGQFPQWVQMQKELERLYMKNCSISGTLSNSFDNYKNLIYLYLSNNHIQGPIPNNFSQMLPSLHRLYLDQNNINESDTLSNSFDNYKNLTYLSLSNNHIQGPIPNNFSQMLPSLQLLYLDQNNINGSLPDSLCEMTSLYDMDLSGNHLSGNLPGCLGYLHKLEILKLSSNEISGIIPNSIGGASLLLFLNLNNNSLTGELPFTLKNCTRLVVMDIGENMFSGNIPKWIGNNLQALRLRNNKFYGHIPSEICQLYKLHILDLANNNLTGGIPNCFGNLSGMVVNVHYEDYINYGSFDEVLKGQERNYFYPISNYLINLDISNNNLVGKIPWELTKLSGLVGLNLSHNHFVGRIPKRIGHMESMESLDLSNNNLSGPIPSSLSDLSFLSHLNLSHNNFSGQIPTGRQLQTLDHDDPSIYEGNPQLCGAPIPKKCEEASMVPSITDNHVAANEGDNIIDDKVLLSIVIITGFATGFWGRWRQASFEFAEERIIRRLFRG